MVSWYNYLLQCYQVQLLSILLFRRGYFLLIILNMFTSIVLWQGKTFMMEPYTNWSFIYSIVEIVFQ